MICFCKGLINPITDPNPVCSHQYTRQYYVVLFYYIVPFLFYSCLLYDILRCSALFRFDVLCSILLYCLLSYPYILSHPIPSYSSLFYSVLFSSLLFSQLISSLFCSFLLHFILLCSIPSYPIMLCSVPFYPVFFCLIFCPILLYCIISFFSIQLCCVLFYSYLSFYILLCPLLFVIYCSALSNHSMHVLPSWPVSSSLIYNLESPSVALLGCGWQACWERCHEVDAFPILTFHGIQKFLKHFRAISTLLRRHEYFRIRSGMKSLSSSSG
jgi:hypothetical protein